MRKFYFHYHVVKGGILYFNETGLFENFWAECFACSKARVYLITKRVRFIEMDKRREGSVNDGPSFYRANVENDKSDEQEIKF